jgi:hypothetical protein
MPFADPEQARTYHRDHKWLQRAGECQTPGQTRLPVEFRLKSAADVLALLAEQVAAVRQDGSIGSVERAGDETPPARERPMIPYLSGSSQPLTPPAL